jgi:hypothetical protein
VVIFEDLRHTGRFTEADLLRRHGVASSMSATLRCGVGGEGPVDRTPAGPFAAGSPGGVPGARERSPASAPGRPSLGPAIPGERPFYGVLSVHAFSRRAFTPHEVRLIRDVAAVVSEWLGQTLLPDDPHGPPPPQRAA